MVARIGLKSALPAKTYFREWREWKGLTQQELADRLETTKATVSRIENGHRRWGKGYLEAFAHVMGCDVTDPISRPPGAPKSLDEMLKGAPAETRQQVLEFAQFLLRKAG